MQVGTFGLALKKSNYYSSTLSEKNRYGKIANTRIIEGNKRRKNYILFNGKRKIELKC